MATVPPSANTADLPTLRFSERFSQDLPADPSRVNHPRQVEGAAYSFVSPSPVSAPRTLAVSSDMMARLGLAASEAETPGFAALFSGNAVPPDSQPYAMNYGGHQFGNWAGQLGDGRAINLGEVRTPSGEHLALQLKGAGTTPYSRGADGRAVLRSSLREFVCSEAMHHLGVPTTRALSLVATGDPVLRDMLYNGNAAHEPGAIVCRVSASFVRFGSFQIHAARGDRDTLRTLIEHTVRHHYPDCLSEGAVDNRAIAAWFRTLCERTAELVVHWQRVGFVHGVLNTDNMSVLGETIDYGPYGWLEDYDPDWTPNTTDAEFRRYRFGQQPAIVLWNLAQLANALLSFTDEVTPLQEGVDHFRSHFEHTWHGMMSSKLGLAGWRDGDQTLVDGLQSLLGATETDMTLFFRALATVPLDTDAPTDGVFRTAWYAPDAVTDAVSQQLADWLLQYRRRCEADPYDADTRRATMQGVNPLYVPRNYLAQLAIDAAEQGDTAPLERWMKALSSPYTEQPGMADLAAKRPEWARTRVGCSMLSCSS
ncbi:MAG: YdiU family protein [Pseudomonadota bacterium]